MLLEGYNHVHLNNWNDNYVIIAVLIPFHCFFMYLNFSILNFQIFQTKILVVQSGLK